MQTITIPVEIQLTARSRALIDALLKIVDAPAAAAPSCATDSSKAVTRQPVIGERIRGGSYAGISRGESGEPDGHIIWLDDIPSGKLNWPDAVKWAKSLGDGARLPTRFESPLLYANLRDQVSPEDWYWTGTQYSAISAWSQLFHGGGQYYGRKSSEGRARAVRRFTTWAL